VVKQLQLLHGSSTTTHLPPKHIMNIRKHLPKMPDLPSSCCCGEVKLPTASRFFATFRLVIAIFILLATLEELFRSDFEEQIELEFDEDFLLENEEFRNATVRKQFQAEHHRQFLYIYYIFLSATIIISVIEIVLCSLQIHGVRKKIVSFVLPYVIWTGILMAVFILIFLLIFSAFVRHPHVVSLIVTLVMGGFLALSISDFIYAVALYKHMRGVVGLDHVLLNEI